MNTIDSISFSRGLNKTSALLYMFEKCQPLDHLHQPMNTVNLLSFVRAPIKHYYIWTKIMTALPSEIRQLRVY